MADLVATGIQLFPGNQGGLIKVAHMADSTNPPTGDKDNNKTKSLAPYLKGLTFRTNKAVEMKDENGKPVMVGGKPRLQYIPVERELQEGDVLKAYEVDGEMVIITKDGRKYRVEK